MKICPKCRGLYFDQDQQCGNCKIELLDKDVFNVVLGEYYQMNHSQRVANRYNARYEIVCKYQFPEIYEYDEQKSQHEYEAFQRRAQQQRIENNRIEKETHIPKCPTCGSTNVQPISTTKKATGFILAGIFSSNFGKSYECKDCKYKW